MIRIKYSEQQDESVRYHIKALPSSDIYRAESMSVRTTYAHARARYTTVLLALVAEGPWSSVPSSHPWWTPYAPWGTYLDLATGTVLRVVLHALRQPRRRERIARSGIREHHLRRSSISMRSLRRNGLEERTDLAGDRVVMQVPVAVNGTAACGTQVTKCEAGYCGA